MKLMNIFLQKKPQRMPASTGYARWLIDERKRRINVSANNPQPQEQQSTVAHAFTSAIEFRNNTSCGYVKCYRNQAEKVVFRLKDLGFSDVKII